MVENVIYKTVEKFEKLDVMVCNAGIQHIEPVNELSYENWKKILNVHLGIFLINIT
jgi:3-hydroxybutyrate dehydrogenase